MIQVTWFLWQRIPALVIGSSLTAISYLVLYALMLVTQGTTPLVIDIVGRSTPESYFSSDEQQENWRREKMRERHRWQLQVSYGLSTERATHFATWMHRAVEKTGVPFPLLAGVIATESGFRYEAASWAGAIGPAQVIPRYWKGSLCEGDLHDPEANILCGAKVLMHYHVDYCQREWICTLSHYNVGPGNIRSGDPYYQEAAQRYVKKVTTRLNQMQYF